jgi:hypothetical protein
VPRSGRETQNRTKPLVVAAITVAILLGIHVLGSRKEPEPAAHAPVLRGDAEGPRPAAKEGSRTSGAPVPADPDPGSAGPAVGGAEKPGSSEPTPLAAEPEHVDARERSVPRAGSPALRVAPPGTPAEVARVFEKLPISPTDGAPIGGIGASGIHVDKISMGTEYRGSECRARSDRFSITKRQRANVCFRVVHQRKDEEVRVLWQKDGGTVRRSRVKVPSVHAYRTRAYLVLREEYAGRWTVRIMSTDGVELAARSFAVVE